MDNSSSDTNRGVDWERALVQRMVNGEESGFDEFAEEFLPRLYRFAASRLHSRDPSGELARDLVQTTLCKAIQKISSFRGEARLFTWLCTCCRNEILMHFRKVERRTVHVELEDFDQGALELPPSGPHHDYSSKEKVQLVHSALDELPSNYAQALEWKYIERLPVQEIADRLAVGLKAAESLLTRARKAFRQSFEELLESPQGIAASPTRGTPDAWSLSVATDLRK